MAASRDIFHGFDCAIANEKSVIEIVDGGADVAGQKVEDVADFWNCVVTGACASIGGDRQMFFAGPTRGEFGKSDDNTCRNAGVGRYGFVAGVASDDARTRMADDARKDQHCRPKIGRAHV